MLKQITCSVSRPFNGQAHAHFEFDAAGRGRMGKRGLPVQESISSLPFEESGELGGHLQGRHCNNWGVIDQPRRHMGTFWTSAPGAAQLLEGQPQECLLCPLAGKLLGRQPASQLGKMQTFISIPAA